MKTGPRWLREGAAVILWSVSAGNVFVYTVKTVLKMYKRPPLSAWQGTGPAQKGKSGSGPSAPNVGKSKGESLPDEALKAGEGLILKEINPLGPAEDLVKGIGGILP